MNFLTLTNPMTHQRAAVAKMLPTRIGGLFMEQGTGKTRVVIELAKLRAHKISKVVIFCPVSLKRVWQDEILKHTDCKPDSIHVFDDRTSERRLQTAWWYVVGIESMSSSNRTVFAINALMDAQTFAVVDESTYIKGHRSMRCERLTAYSEIARYRMILTGTPLTNGVKDLFAQMRFLSPKILGYQSFYSFANNHLEYSKRHKGMIARALNTEVLAEKIGPYVYQVTKDECLDLPGKIYKHRYFYLTDEQRAAYDRAKFELLDLVPDEYCDLMFAIFRLFTALQQITSGFWSRRESPDDDLECAMFPHRRLETLAEILHEIPAHEKVVIWAKYHFDIQGIARMLAKGFPDQSAAFFHGKLSEHKRNTQLDRFRNDARFLVATPSCGGHGLTLNEAAHHVFYNNGFKYSERLQAEDRSHRIGQTKPVIYWDIVCADTIDERILRALAKKEDAADSFRREVERVKKEKLKERLMNL